MANRQIVIHRSYPKETRIQNCIIWDQSISTAARFSLIAMLSLPDSWDYSVRGMASMLHVSKDTMGRYLKELERAGYLRRAQDSDARGRFAGTQYIITDTPGKFGEMEPCPKNYDTEEPCPNLPDPDLPDPEKSPQKKRTEEKKRTEQKNPPKAPQGGRRGSRFELAEEAKPILRAYVGEDLELAQALGEHIRIRAKLRAVNSVYAVRLLLTKLDELSGGRREDKLRLIRQSVANSWKSYFPLRGGPPAQPEPDASALVPSEEVPTW